MVPLLSGDSRAPHRGDALHYPHFTAEKTRHRGEATRDTCLLGLAPAQAGLEILLVVCMCPGVSLPNTGLDKPPAVPVCGSSTSESLSWRRNADSLMWQEGNNHFPSVLVYHIVSVGNLCERLICYV